MRTAQPNDRIRRWLQAGPDAWKRRCVWLSIFAAAFWLRVCFIFFLHPPQDTVSIFSDMRGYYDSAVDIVDGRGPGGGLGASFKPIGYPYYVALSMWLHKLGFFAERLQALGWMNLLLSSLLPFLLWGISRRWLGQRTALIVLVIGLFYFPLTIYAGYVMAELPFTFLLALLAWGIVRFRYPWRPGAAVFLGLVWGLSVLMKGQSMPVLPVCLFVSALPLLGREPVSKQRLFRYVRAWGTFAATGLVVLSLQGLCSWRYTGRFVPTPTVSATTIIAAKMPECRFVNFLDSSFCNPTLGYDGGCDPAHQCWFDAKSSDTRHVDGLALDLTVQQPIRFFQGMKNGLRLFLGNEGVPQAWDSEWRFINRYYDYFYVLFLVPGVLLGFLRFFTSRQPMRIRLLGMVAIAGIVPFFVLTDSEIRYRYPFDVILIPMALRGWTAAFMRFRQLARFARSNVLVVFWFSLLAPWIVYDILWKMLAHQPHAFWIFRLAVFALAAAAVLEGFTHWQTSRRQEVSVKMEPIKRRAVARPRRRTHG